MLPSMLSMVNLLLSLTAAARVSTGTYSAAGNWVSSKERRVWQICASGSALSLDVKSANRFLAPLRQTKARRTRWLCWMRRW